MSMSEEIRSSSPGPSIRELQFGSSDLYTLTL
jgi:hypothetical protein